MPDGAARPFPVFNHESTVVTNAEAVALGENVLLGAWGPDIRRAASWGAMRIQARRADAEDFAQEAGLRLVLAVRKVGHAQPGYLRRVIRNSVASSIRRERRAITTISPRGQQLTEDLETPDSWGRLERRRTIAAWVAALPPRLRQLHEMLYEHGMTQAEAAAELHLSQSRVAQLHRDLLTRGRLELAELVA